MSPLPECQHWEGMDIVSLVLRCMQCPAPGGAQSVCVRTEEGNGRSDTRFSKAPAGLEVNQERETELHLGG